MTKAMTATERGLAPHWKVRVVLPGALLHLASRTEPVVQQGAGEAGEVSADWICAPDYGDTIGHLDWTKVIAITWRYSP